VDPPYPSLGAVARIPLEILVGEPASLSLPKGSESVTGNTNINFIRFFALSIQEETEISDSDSGYV
jgi:hypothetical protein